MVGTGLVILGAILILVLAGAGRSQEAPPVAVQVRDDAARREEMLGRRQVRDGR